MFSFYEIVATFLYYKLLNHQFIQKLKLVVEGNFNYISPTLPLTCGLEIFERLNKWNQFHLTFEFEIFKGPTSGN